MKTILSLAIIFLVLTEVRAEADSIAAQVSMKIAKNLAEALLLTDDQKSAIYNANMRLNSEKALIWKTYNSPDSIRLHLQRIENQRDSYYQYVFGSNEKYLLYLEKKRQLVSAD